MTTIYLMRHSQAEKDIDYTKVNEDFESINKQFILSIAGEKKAYRYSKIKELSNINMVISSNYVRAISTAKYIASNNKKKVVVDDLFNERKFGIADKSKLPVDFFKKQFLNHDYKLKGGESFDDVKQRAIKGLIKVIKSNMGKKALIVTHSSAITFMLSKWCDVEYNGRYIIRYKDKVIIDGFGAPDLIELKFNEKNKLVKIRRVEIKSKK